MQMLETACLVPGVSCRSYTSSKLCILILILILQLPWLQLMVAFISYLQIQQPLSLDICISDKLDSRKQATHRASIDVEDTVGNVHQQPCVPGVAHIAMEMLQQWEQVLCISPTYISSFSDWLGQSQSYGLTGCRTRLELCTLSAALYGTIPAHVTMQHMSGCSCFRLDQETCCEGSRLGLLQQSADSGVLAAGKFDMSS